MEDLHRTKSIRATGLLLVKFELYILSQSAPLLPFLLLGNLGLLVLIRLAVRDMEVAHSRATHVRSRDMIPTI
jgi:hypothetical protein